MKTDLRWIFVGYLAAILLCFAWKARFVVAANLAGADTVLLAPVANNNDAGRLDEKIISDAVSLLQRDMRWTQNDDEFCVPDRPLTLYCALAIAAKSNGLNITPTSSYVLRVTASIRAAASDSAEAPKLATRPYSAIIEFNNHSTSDRDAVISTLRRAQASESSQ